MWQVCSRHQLGGGNTTRGETTITQQLHNSIIIVKYGSTYLLCYQMAQILSEMPAHFHLTMYTFHLVSELGLIRIRNASCTISDEMCI